MISVWLAVTDGGGGSLEVPWLAALGPFAAAAGFAIYHIRDLQSRIKLKDAVITTKDDVIAKQNEDTLEIMKLVLPALAEGRDTVRDNTRTMSSATKAMEGLKEIAGRIPDNNEVTLLRYLLAQLQQKG